MFRLACCINLTRREDRWAEFKARLPQDWPLARKIRRFPAVEGKKCVPPGWWKESAGAWGCYRSHLGILEDCLNNGIESVVVFEDDAVFGPHFTAELQKLLQAVPSDWQMLYLGGQLLKHHFRPPEKINEWVYRPFNVNRAHAYAVRGEGLRLLYQHLTSLDWYENYHVDHHYGRLHEQGSVRVYCPRRWLVGQLGSKSDINGRNTTTTFWTHPEQAHAQGQSSFLMVLGLHESGSSVVAMALHHLGFFLGDELGGCAPGGGGECRKLAALCERAAKFPGQQIEMARPELTARLGDWLGHHLWRAECEKKPAAGNYPHLCALAPYFQAFCGPKLRAIHVRRPLADSISALQNRLGGSTASRETLEACERVQCWLWQEQEKFLSRVPHGTIEYAELLADPQAAVARVLKDQHLA